MFPSLLLFSANSGFFVIIIPASLWIVYFHTIILQTSHDAKQIYFFVYNNKNQVVETINNYFLSAETELFSTFSRGISSQNTNALTTDNVTRTNTP